MKTFFISYNKADVAWAQWIAYQLEDAHYSTVSQIWDFFAGNNFVLDMHRANQEAEHTIALLSPDYLNPEAGFSQAEWAAAFKEDPTGEKGKLIPIRVRECTPQGLLGPISYIDLVGLDRPAARVKLLTDVARKRRKPTSEPPFPPSLVPPS